MALAGSAFGTDAQARERNAKMSVITPFAAIRPPPEKAAQVSAPPYDVLDSAEAHAMAQGNPLSFLRVSKPEIDFSEDIDPYSDAVYARGVENLNALIDEGHMIREARPCLYLYRQIMQINGVQQTQIGVVAACSVAEYEAGLIKKHELTRAEKEADRTRHVQETNANTGPVFLAYRACPDIDAIVTRNSAGAPVYDFTAADGIQHTVWVVDAPEEIDALVAAFSQVPALYIADGHHRAASAATVCRRRRAATPNPTGDERFNFFLAVMFPHDQLYIMDYNRFVFDLNGLDEAAFLQRVSEKFDVQPTDVREPKQAQDFGMYLGGKWYLLRTRNGSFNNSCPVSRLDVDILQQNLLHPILGIGDPRTDTRIDFIGGIRGMDELERRVDERPGSVAFSTFATSMDQLMAIADAGCTMPPKSTWFEPKLRSGLLVHALD